MIRKLIYTIGHSTHTIEFFISMLKINNINTVIDIRSVPYSKFAVQFNKDNIALELKENRVHYINMGDQLGARYNDSSMLFNDGKVDFSKVEKTDNFIDGIKRIELGIQNGYTIVLMCSEKNPLECHRFSMVSHYLSKTGYEVLHILPNLIIEHKILEDKLFEYYQSKGKVSLNLDKILSINDQQYNFLTFETKEEMYIALNKLVAYDSFINKESSF